MLTNRTLARINNRPRGVNLLPLLAVGGGTLVLVAPLYVFEFLPPLSALAVLGGGTLLVLLLYAAQKSKTTICLSYKGKLDDETAAHFSEVREALEGLISSEGVWSLPVSSKPPKTGEAAPIPGERQAVRIGLLPTPGIKADTPIWGIGAHDDTLYFFPEGMLCYRNDRYDPVSYNALKMALSSGRFFEEGEVPSDATVVETVWRFSRPDGSPDPRYKKDNVEIPIILYNLLSITGPSGLALRLMVSNRRAATRFARTFGADDLREKPRRESSAGAASDRAQGHASSNGQKDQKEKYRSAKDLEKEARLARARKALGVGKEASAEQIGAAYRELARTHHPDKVASLEPEVREYSEQRMKEINIAYAELRREWRDSASEGARTG